MVSARSTAAFPGFTGAKVRIDVYFIGSIIQKHIQVIVHTQSQRRLFIGELKNMFCKIGITGVVYGVGIVVNGFFSIHLQRLLSRWCSHGAVREQSVCSFNHLLQLWKIDLLIISLGSAELGNDKCAFIYNAVSKVIYNGIVTVAAQGIAFLFNFAMIWLCFSCRMFSIVVSTSVKFARMTELSFKT
ncbi:MAG: hypothetical protein ACLTW9_27155 [Enterocloster sp.]